MRCEGPYDMQVSCLNRYYTKMTTSNELEWEYAFNHLWWTQAWLGFLGPILIPASVIYSWIVLVFPDSKPDIDNVKDLKDKPLSKTWYNWMVLNSMTSESGLFILTQMLTGGQSDLRDFSIIYMTSFETFLYMNINALWMSIWYLPAAVWFALTFWIYGIQLILELFIDGDKGGRDGPKGPGGRGPGGRDGGDGGDGQRPSRD